jgi:hypothetical protein
MPRIVLRVISRNNDRAASNSRAPRRSLCRLADVPIEGEIAVPEFGISGALACGDDRGGKHDDDADDDGHEGDDDDD